MEQQKNIPTMTKPPVARPGSNRPERPRPDRPRPDRPKKRTKKVPAWAKALIITGLLFSSLIFGMKIGYSFIGNGPISDVFSFSTWKHILDLIIG